MTDSDVQLAAAAYLRKIAAGDHASALALVPTDPETFAAWAATLAGYTVAALGRTAKALHMPVGEFLDRWLDHQLDQRKENDQ